MKPSLNPWKVDENYCQSAPKKIIRFQKKIELKRVSGDSKQVIFFFRKVFSINPPSSKKSSRFPKYLNQNVFEEILICHSCIGWQEESGGYTSYIAKGEDEEVNYVFVIDLVFRDGYIALTFIEWNYYPFRLHFVNSDIP